MIGIWRCTGMYAFNNNVDRHPSYEFILCMYRPMVLCTWMVCEDCMDGNGCLYLKRFLPLFLAYFATLCCPTTQKRHHVRHFESLTGFKDLTLFSAYDSFE